MGTDGPRIIARRAPRVTRAQALATGWQPDPPSTVARGAPSVSTGGILRAPRFPERQEVFVRIGSRPSTSAEDISGNVKAFVDKLLDAQVADTLAKRSREIAAAVGDATGVAVERAGETWQETAPARAEAMKSVMRASDDATRWGARAWRKQLRPLVNDLWKRRTVAIGAAGAAIPAGRGLVDTAAQRIGLKQREERHWGAFFLGMLLGAAAGVVAALLTAPKRGSELRDELAVKAQAAAEIAGQKAQQAVEVVGERAQAVAGDWVPLFQRDESDTNGAADITDASITTGIDSDSGISVDTDALTSTSEADAFEAPIPVTDAGSAPETPDEMSDAVAREVDDPA
jgi:gas vesicle protein